jgi:hypothetical protein
MFGGVITGNPILLFKGINKRTNQITKDKYMDVLLLKKSGSSTNRGFRSMENQVLIYFQERSECASHLKSLMVL